MFLETRDLDRISRQASESVMLEYYSHRTNGEHDPRSLGFSEGMVHGIALLTQLLSQEEAALVGRMFDEEERRMAKHDDPMAAREDRER